ncbi:MAG TPA: hypothetical protein VG477_08980, partial [Thermoanaerobaculia bacterium]|nr:hypothetical protein [Thermoanaerobaculia bacterium]
MSIVNPRPQAAPVSGAAFAYHRTGRLAKWLGDRRGHRIVLSLAAGLFGELFSSWSGGLLFPFTPAVSLTAGLLFGWQGILGAALGQFAAVWLLLRSIPSALAFSASFAVTGAAAWLLFRYVPKLGRGLPNLRSFLWTLGAALVGGLAGSVITFLLVRPVEAPAIWIWTWATGALISVVLLAPPILLAMDRRGRRWMAPLPNEFQALDPHAEERAVADAGEETLVLAPPAPDPTISRDVLTGIAMVLSAGLGALTLVGLLPRWNGWATLLYLLPILWAALRHGLRGGILAASGSGFAHLVGLAWMAVAHGAAEIGRDVWAGRADLLILSLAGALVGWSRERELRLREELLESNRLLRRDLVRISE